ncbi:MAG: putative glycoside hydrolase [Gemmatimonadaceae bacterium]
MSSLYRTIVAVVASARAGRTVSALTVCCMLALAACHAGEAAKSAAGARGTDSAALASDSGRAGASAAGASAAPAGQAPPAAQGALTASPAVRGLYVNRFAAQSTKRMRKLIDVADQTEINGFVIDMKDEFGLNYVTANADFARNAGTMGKVRELKPLLDTLKAHDILAIARIVVFKDSVTARVHPEWTIRRTDGAIWRDHKGLAWVNPYHRELWDYNIGVAEELVKLGFGEVQFDYIRFPEPYKSLPQQVFPEHRDQSKPDAIAEFLRTANMRLDKLGVRTTADIFGLVTTVRGPLEVGQEWEKVAPVTDVLLPMVYPSHYPRGAFGVARPNADPYKIILAAISKANERDRKLGITSAEHVRPWLQAFTLGQPAYGPQQITEQKRAVYDSGYDGWVLWHPGSLYEPFLPALEKTLVSRKKAVAASMTGG